MNAAPKPVALAVGLKHSDAMTVTARHTVPKVADWPGFADMPEVLATAMMVGFMEQVCVMALRPFLSDAQRTVGTHVSMSHVAATPVGMSVTAQVELVEINGASLLFKVACHDDAGLIGEGMHRRSIIDLNRFNTRLRERAATRAEP
jgi:fluoroacetyl-CoA thioesterase